MIKKTRYSVEALPVIPEGSEFKVNGKFAKNGEDGNLELYYPQFNTWISAEMTLEKYTTYWDKSKDEFTLHEYIYHVWGNSYLCKNIYFFFNPAKKYFGTSYNKPVKKGTVVKDGETLDIIKAGETIKICSTSYPQIISLIEMYGDFDLYKFEDKVRSAFEQSILITGAAVPEYSKDQRSYIEDYDLPNYNVLFRDFCDQYFYDILGIELKKDD